MAHRQAWEKRDSNAAGMLFTEDAAYQENPFDQPMRGRSAKIEYWTHVPRTQENIHFSHEITALTGATAIALVDLIHAHSIKLQSKTRRHLPTEFHGKQPAQEPPRMVGKAGKLPRHLLALPNGQSRLSLSLMHSQHQSLSSLTSLMPQLRHLTIPTRVSNDGFPPLPEQLNCHSLMTPFTE
jgi:hypothetical protein